MAELEARLGPILRPDAPSVETPNQKSPELCEVDSPHIDNLKSLNRNISQINTHARNILSRCET